MAVQDEIRTGRHGPQPGGGIILLVTIRAQEIPGGGLSNHHNNGTRFPKVFFRWNHFQTGKVFPVKAGEFCRFVKILFGKVKPFRYTCLVEYMGAVGTGCYKKHQHTGQGFPGKKPTGRLG